MRRTPAQGYVAMVTAIMIGAMFLLIVLTLSLRSFISRANSSVAQFKEISWALAESCIETARLRLSQNSQYAGGETVNVASDTCAILSVIPSGSNRIISTQARYQSAVTDLKAIVGATTLSILDWEELRSFGE